jgi:hypothetical protein
MAPGCADAAPPAERERRVGRPHRPGAGSHRDRVGPRRRLLDLPRGETLKHVGIKARASVRAIARAKFSDVHISGAGVKAVSFFLTA